jgi:hypothetical protein
MQHFPAGKYVRGYLLSNDMTTAVDVPLFDADGNTVTPLVGERLIITELLINNGATQATFTIFTDINYNGAVDAGEALYRVTLVADDTGGFTGMSFDGLAGAAIKASPAGSGKVRVVASIGSVGASVMFVGKLVGA